MLLVGACLVNKQLKVVKSKTKLPIWLFIYGS